MSSDSSAIRAQSQVSRSLASLLDHQRNLARSLFLLPAIGAHFLPATYPPATATTQNEFGLVFHQCLLILKSCGSARAISAGKRARRSRYHAVLDLPSLIHGCVRDLEAARYSARGLTPCALRPASWRARSRSFLRAALAAPLLLAPLPSATVLRHVARKNTPHVAPPTLRTELLKRPCNPHLHALVIGLALAHRAPSPRRTRAYPRRPPELEGWRERPILCGGCNSVSTGSCTIKWSRRPPIFVKCPFRAMRSHGIAALPNPPRLRASLPAPFGFFDLIQSGDRPEG